jgi:hypothetical protein
VKKAALTEMYFVMLTVMGRAVAPFRLEGAKLEPTHIYASGCVAYIASDINDCLDFDSSDSFHCRYLNSLMPSFNSHDDIAKKRQIPIRLIKSSLGWVLRFCYERPLIQLISSFITNLQVASRLMRPRSDLTAYRNTNVHPFKPGLLLHFEPLLVQKNVGLAESFISGAFGVCCRENAGSSGELTGA